MSARKVIGIIIIIGGVVLIGISQYIKKQILGGEAQIAAGEQKIKSTEQMFSLNPQTKPLGEQLTKSGKSQIAQGREEIAYYTRLANQLQIGGIILIVVGGIIFVTGFRRKK